MGHKNPIWDLFDDNDEIYKNNKSNKAARCKVCMQFYIAQLKQEEIVAVAQGATPLPNRTDKQWKELGA